MHAYGSHMVLTALHSWGSTFGVNSVTPLPTPGNINTLLKTPGPHKFTGGLGEAAEVRSTDAGGGQRGLGLCLWRSRAVTLGKLLQPRFPALKNGVTELSSDTGPL